MTPHPAERPVMTMGDRARLGAIFAMALTFRLGLLYAYSPAAPWVGNLTLADAEMGRNILAGRGWVANATVIDRAVAAQDGHATMVDLEQFLPANDDEAGALITQGTAHSPGYSLWFAASYWLGGHVRYVYSQIMQSVLDACACLLIFAIGRRLWSTSAGLCAAFLYALSPAHAFLSNLTVAASTDSFWFLTVAYGAVRAWSAMDEGRRPWSGALIVATGGLCAAAMNSTGLLLPSVVTGMALVATVFDRRALRLVPYFVAAQILVMTALTPWALRNERLFGQFSPVRGGFWQVAFASWGELPNPWGMGFDDKYYWNWIEERCDGCNSGAQAEKTRDFILHDVVPSPGFVGHIGRLVAYRLPHLIDVARLQGGFYNPALGGRTRSVLRTYFRITDYAVFGVVLLIVMGLVMATVRRGMAPVVLLAIGPSIFLISFSLVFFVELRKTAPAYGGLIVFAGIALSMLLRQRRAVAAAVITLSTLAVSPSVHADVMSAGQMHSVVAKPDGTVWSWGINLRGQLGEGTSGNTILEGTQAKAIGDVVAVAAGGHHTVALQKNGTVLTWGDNSWGELGDGSRRTRGEPSVVPKLERIVAVAAGYLHSLALADDGTVWAWGDNHFGQLGVASPAWSVTPVRVPGVKARAIRAGFFHTLAIDADGQLWSWGQNEQGQLGDANLAPRSQPRLVAEPGRVTDASGGQYHTMAVDEAGRVWTFGGNTFGQLGRPTTMRINPRPDVVPSLSAVRLVAAGEDHSVALTHAGEVWTWGDNLYGQLGDGTFDRRLSPTQPVGVAPAIGIASGHAHVLATRAGGAIYSWGFSSEGELGDNLIVRRLPTPRTINAVTLVPGPDFDAATFQPAGPVDALHLAAVVTADGGRFLIKGKAETPTAYVLSAPPTIAGPDEPLKVLAARGTVIRGCLTIGVQENNAWVFYKNYSREGPFTFTWAPARRGDYTVVAAHCLAEDETQNNVELTRLGWFKDATMGRPTP